MKISTVSGGAMFVLALALSGCSKKVPECNSVVAVIHTASDAIKGNKAEGPEKVKAIIAIDEKAVADLGKLELTIPEIKKFSDDFKKSYQTDAEQTKKMGPLIEAGDAEKIAAFSKETEASGAELTKLAENFDKFCQAP